MNRFLCIESDLHSWLLITSFLNLQEKNLSKENQLLEYGIFIDEITIFGYSPPLL